MPSPVNRSRRRKRGWKAEKIEDEEDAPRVVDFEVNLSACTRSNGPRTIFRLACYRFWNFWTSESSSIREKCAEKMKSLFHSFRNIFANRANSIIIFNITTCKGNKSS